MDKYARQTYIHNYGEPKYYPTDVYEREIPEESLEIYMTSPPCQAFSLAGKRLGKDDKRGILFFNSHEFIKVNKPRFFIFENVKGLLSDDGGKTFSEWVNMLGGKSINGTLVMFPHEDSVPYHLYWKVLNARDYGVPQNRERVFLIGIRDDKDNNFRFPAEEHLTRRLKDVLEEEVEQKYFLSEKMIDYISKDRNGNYHLETNRDVANTITCEIKKMQRSMQDNYIDVVQLNPSKESNGKQPYQQNRVYDGDGISPAINSGQENWGGNIVRYTSKRLNETLDKFDHDLPKDKPVIIDAYNKTINENSIYIDTRINAANNTFVSIPTNKYQKEIEQSLSQDVCTGIDASYYKGFGVRQGKCRQVVAQDYKIRRLTPRECFRLMDFPDTFTWTCSDSQAYRQAGNSIVVNVLYKILQRLPL
jgi:DNA (cytosine-5)-methyltransferase 1